MSACAEIIDDIEDLISSQDITPKERYSNKSNNVTVRARRRNAATERAAAAAAAAVAEATNDCDTDDATTLNYATGSAADAVVVDDNDTSPAAPRSHVPGTQTIYIKTWGCAHNSSDTEYMAGQLAAYGYPLTQQRDAADLWLLNSCTVKQPSEDTFRNDIAAARAAGKPVVVAGCVPQGAPRSAYLRGLSVVGVQQIDRVVEVVEETLKGHSVRLLAPKKDAARRRLGGAPLALPKIRKNRLIEIIAINTGCLNQCTYCKTKHARGDLASYPAAEIVARARQAFAEGCREIWLTSEDTGTWGRDLGGSLPELLWQLVAVIPRGCMMRVGMTNPPYILEHLDEIGRVLQAPQVYAFLHVPVQSGSTAVLADMRREYSREDFERVVDVLRERVPGITIATDIIAGFPTETAADWADTMSLCAKYRFPSLFINQFFARPGTPAARMPRVPTQEVKRRTRALTELFHSYEPYARRVGGRERVLVTEVSADGRHYVGHNKFYEQTLLPMTEGLMGRMVWVRVTAATKWSVFADVEEVEEEDEALKAMAAAAASGTSDDEVRSCGSSSGCGDVEEETTETVDKALQYAPTQCMSRLLTAANVQRLLVALMPLVAAQLWLWYNWF